MKITKFKRKNFILSFIVFLTYAFLTITINSCKKEIQTDLQVGRLNIGNNNTLEVLKGAFTAGDYQKKLSRNFNDSLVITWKPDWQSVTEKMGNDTLNYFYIPLNGEFYNKKTGISKKIRTINTDKYLIGFLNKKGIKYKVGTYVVQTDTSKFDYTINSNSKKIKSVQFINHTVKYSKFSGTLVLLDLYSNKTNTYKYNNGIYQPKNQKISANSQSKNSNSSQINTNAEFCSYTLTCTYFNNFQDACGDGIDYEENSTPINDPNIGEQNCTPPPSAASDHYGGLCYIYWEFGGYNVQLDFCFTIPDPPPPPQDPVDGSIDNAAAQDTIIDQSIKNNPKLNCINGKLADNVVFNNLIKKFVKSSTYNLLIKAAPLNREESGLTTFYSGLKNGNVTITINTNKIDIASIDLATTFIHEAFHAFIDQNLIQRNLTGTNVFNQTYADTFDQYVTAQVDSVRSARMALNQPFDSNTVSHDIIAANIDIIANGVKQYAEEAWPALKTDPYISFDNYRATAWASKGLAGSTSYAKEFNTADKVKDLNNNRNAILQSTTNDCN